MRLNPNRFFRWLSIRSKLIIAFAGLSVIPVAFLGIYGVTMDTKIMESNALDNLVHDVQTLREKTANFLSNVQSDLHLFQNSSLLRRYVGEVERKPDGSHSIAISNQVNDEILSFAQTKHIYYKIRVIGRDGDELVCVRSDTNDAYRIVPNDQLRQGNETYYFLLVKDLQPGQIAVAPAELLDYRKNLVPVISFAMPLGGKPKPAGILIADVFAKDLFRVIEGRRHMAVGGKVILATGAGHYIYHSEKKRDWNMLVASREEANLSRDYPDSVVRHLLSGREGTLEEGLDEIISYAPLFPNPKKTGANGIVTGFTVPIIVMESVSKDLILGSVRSFAFTFGTFLFLFLIAAVGLGLLATRQFTKPIGELQQGAEIIAKGNYRHRLRVDTRDEIEKLAEQFNTMAASLEEHEAEIRNHRMKLEEMVDRRTAELSGEKAKLQAIIDNVPSAFVLLNKDGKILTASDVFSVVTARENGGVIGGECNSVICGDSFCQDCLCRRTRLSGKTETHIDEIFTAKRESRFLEHIAVPLREAGEMVAILQIITDVTERKLLEQKLLRSERIVAAGEMSSIIAHEFRNSLTSVKMILQLQRELKHLSRSDKKSVGVALNSIDHMDEVVTELLDFAKPKSLDYKILSLGGIIHDTLAMIRVHTAKNRIQVRLDYDENMPDIRIDGARFKEALVNILLNAVQSMDGFTRRDRKKEIRITVRKTRLRKALRESNTAGSGPGGSSRPSQEEIVLGKGVDCCHIEISDTGCGIDRAHLERVFDPFYTTKTNGTGLGLPMVKRTINAHGGIISVRSAKGRGTTLNIIFPIGTAGGTP